MGTRGHSEVCMQVIESLVLIDAVCLLTCWPSLLHNFIYAPPAWSLHGKGILDSIRFMLSRDIMIAEVRPYVWTLLTSRIIQMPLLAFNNISL